jgi:hypothetical protein
MKQPKQGRVDIRSGDLVYTHNANSIDSVEVAICGSSGSVQTVAVFIINSLDIYKPIVVIQPLRVNESQRRIITSYDLNITQLELNGKNLKIRIIRRPNHGQIKLDGSPGITQFTLSDITNIRVECVHDGSEITEDSFLFVISDGRHEDFYVYPNLESTVRRPQVFSIIVMAVDNLVPRIVNNKVASSLVDDEAGNIYLFTPSDLKVTDRDSTDEDLMFVIQQSPVVRYVTVDKVEIFDLA